MKKPLWKGLILRGLLLRNSNKAAIQDRSMFNSKVGIAPYPEFLNLIHDQCPDRFEELFFEEPCIEAHPGEYRLEII
jgi:hypothetical protein